MSVTKSQCPYTSRDHWSKTHYVYFISSFSMEECIVYQPLT